MYLKKKYKMKKTVPILLDTGSAVTVIDEEIWGFIRKKNNHLEKVPFAIRSVTQHNIEILGQQRIEIALPRKQRKGNSIYNINVLIAKGLLHKAILGLDFLEKFGANINVTDRKLMLYVHGMKAVHELYQSKSRQKSVNVIVAEEAIIEARTEKRIQCVLAEEVEDGNEIYFEPDATFLATSVISVAAVIDVIKNSSVTAQVINPTQNSATLRSGTIVGQIELLLDSTRNENIIENTNYVKRSAEEREWLKNIDIGDTNFKKEEVVKIKELLHEFQDVFSKNDNDLGRCGIIPHSIEIVGEKPKRVGARPMNPAMRQVLEEQSARTTG
jgi:hypothetical protein